MRLDTIPETQMLPLTLGRLLTPRSRTKISFAAPLAMLLYVVVAFILKYLLGISLPEIFSTNVVTALVLGCILVVLCLIPGMYLYEKFVYKQLIYRCWDENGAIEMLGLFFISALAFLILPFILVYGIAYLIQ